MVRNIFSPIYSLLQDLTLSTFRLFEIHALNHYVEHSIQKGRSFFSTPVYLLFPINCYINHNCNEPLKGFVEAYNHICMLRLYLQVLYSYDRFSLSSWFRSLKSYDIRVIFFILNQLVEAYSYEIHTFIDISRNFLAVFI